MPVAAAHGAVGRAASMEQPPRSSAWFLTQGRKVSDKGESETTGKKKQLSIFFFSG